MSKIDVIKVNWVKENEVHLDPPGGGRTWWARPVRSYLGNDEIWELFGESEEEAEGYFDDLDAMFEHVSREFDNAPVIVTREREQ